MVAVPVFILDTYTPRLFWISEINRIRIRVDGPVVLILVLLALDFVADYEVVVFAEVWTHEHEFVVGVLGVGVLVAHLVGLALQILIFLVFIFIPVLLLV